VDFRKRWAVYATAIELEKEEQKMATEASDADDARDDAPLVFSRVAQKSEAPDEG